MDKILEKSAEIAAQTQHWEDVVGQLTRLVLELTKKVHGHEAELKAKPKTKAK